MVSRGATNGGVPASGDAASAGTRARIPMGFAWMLLVGLVFVVLSVLALTTL